jgi:hypothetical protein
MPYDFWYNCRSVYCRFADCDSTMQGILKGKYHFTIDLLFDWLGISSMKAKADNFCFYLQNRLIQTSQTGGQRYSDTSPFSIPCTVVKMQARHQHLKLLQLRR